MEEEEGGADEEEDGVVGVVADVVGSGGDEFEHIMQEFVAQSCLGVIERFQWFCLLSSCIKILYFAT